MVISDFMSNSLEPAQHFFLLFFIFNFIRCSIEQQPHEKQLKQSNNTGVSVMIA